MNLLFLLLAAITCGGAIAAILLRNTIHCALALTAVFAGLAALFLHLDAEFAGLVEVLVYIGAVAILVVFAILLTRAFDNPMDGIYSRGWWVGISIAGAVFALLAWAIIGSSWMLSGSSHAPTVTVRQIGEALVGRYVLPLEVVAVLLTVAMLGAVIVALYEKEKKEGRS